MCIHNAPFSIVFQLYCDIHTIYMVEECKVPGENYRSVTLHKLKLHRVHMVIYIYMLYIAVQNVSMVNWCAPRVPYRSWVRGKFGPIQDFNISMC